MTVPKQESCQRAWKEPAQIAALTAVRVPVRARQQKWDEAHIRTASCRLTTAENDRFKIACRRLGVTRYQVIRYMILLFLHGVQRERS